MTTTACRSNLFPCSLRQDFQDYIPGEWWKLPPMRCGKGDEEGTVVLLDVREPTPVIVLSLHKTAVTVWSRVFVPVAVCKAALTTKPDLSDLQYSGCGKPAALRA
jgi:hypothetical protein